MKKHTVNQLVREINDGNTFGVTFVKRTNSEVRTMNARRGVKKGVKNDPGVNGSWNRKAQDAEHNMITCYDMNVIEKIGEKGAFRRIPLDSLIEVHHHGKNLIMDHEKGVLVEVSEEEAEGLRQKAQEKALENVEKMKEEEKRKKEEEKLRKKEAKKQAK